MRIKSFLMLGAAGLGAAALLLPAAAQASGDTLKNARTYMTYTTLAQVASSKTSGYSGVGSLFVEYQSTATTGFGSLCTGSLLNAKTVVTAAHCMYDYDGGNYDPVTAVYFITPSYGALIDGTPGADLITATNWAINPLFDNPGHDLFTGILAGYDVALFSLSDYAHGLDTYDIYTGDPLTSYTEVGTGTIGGPQGTDIGVDDDYLKRVGSNIYELYGDDLFPGLISHGVVLSDFDDGTAEHDVFGLLGLPQTGVPGEASSSPGDSGGPSFINGKIAAVTSFGDTGGDILYGYCGGDSVDPYNELGGTELTPLQYCTNSSVGEFNGNTLLSYNLDFIEAYLDANPVPEPATWAQMIAGFALLGGMTRRARRTSVRMVLARA